jgi:glycosyltransferase involved in cell wall biosynthesis
MRIFQIVTLSELGGAQSVVVQLSNSLGKEHEIIVIAGEGDGKMFQMLDSGVQYIKLKYLKRKISPLNEFLTMIVFLKLYRKYKPDIIHLHSSKVGMLGRLIFPKNKTIYTVHGFDSIRMAYRKYLPIERFLQNRCKAIVAVSRYDEKKLKEERITHNVTYVYNGI